MPASHLFQFDEHDSHGLASAAMGKQTDLEIIVALFNVAWLIIGKLSALAFEVVTCFSAC
jgi:hypothetical protein